MNDHLEEEEFPQITELSKIQRRVIGVLVEKAFTTPEYYPMTLKALTNGCNQKSNRSPVVNYSEDQVAEALDELRELGLVATLHTETGRTERYRHYMRHRFTLTEPQLAILTELLLRGRQQLGELRTRSSRMVPIETLEQLREELHGLQQMNLVQTSGPLERRGTEVDHNWYRPQEGRTLEAAATPQENTSGVQDAAVAAASPSSAPGNGAAPANGASSDWADRLSQLESSNERLQREHQDLIAETQALKEEIRQLNDRFEELRRELGG